MFILNTLMFLNAGTPPQQFARESLAQLAHQLLGMYVRTYMCVLHMYMYVHTSVHVQYIQLQGLKHLHFACTRNVFDVIVSAFHAYLLCIHKF